MKSNLPILDYDVYDPESKDTSESLLKSVEKCPMESLLWVGRPSLEDQAAVADEVLPDRIKAEFESTVDKAEWRG